MLRVSHRPPHAIQRVLSVPQAGDDFLQLHGVMETRIDTTEAFGPRLPSRFTLGPEMTEARNQLSGETCTSFGVASCLEYFHKRDLSEANLIDRAERRFDDCRAGLPIEHAMVAAKLEGVVDEHFWQYDDSKICWANPPTVAGLPRYSFADIRTTYRRPAQHVVQLMVRAVNVNTANTTPPGPMASSGSETLKSVLAVLRHPIAVDVPVWWDASGHFTSGWDWGPHIDMPTPANLSSWLAIAGVPPYVDGWHVIALTGFDDQQSRYFFKNSWGRWWGHDGFGTIPYEYIDRYSRLGMHGWT